MHQFDLEDIESHLYSQIYHSNENENDNPSNIVDNPQETTEDMRRTNRYFQNGPTRVRKKFQNKRFGQPNLNSPNSNKNGNKRPNQDRYSKDYSKPNQPGLPLNQFLVITPSPQNVKVLTSKQIRAARYKANKVLERSRIPSEKTNNKPVHKRFDTENVGSTSTSKNVRDVIVLSDSEEDEDSCIVVPQNWPQLTLDDSDDERNTIKTSGKPETISKNQESTSIDKAVEQNSVHKTSDDVIFVEPDNASDEIINLDEESQLQKLHSSENITPSKSSTYLPKERKELLSTPDSASNDFIGNSAVPLSQVKFNFGLHGADFKDSEFVKPAKPNETCETESSSSTTDLNPLKTVVFNEIEFPKEDIFSEANLESFGKFITPKRTASKSILSSTPYEEKSLKNNLKLPDTDSDSSDSENATTACKPKVTKKPKKTLNFTSKYDLIYNEDNLEDIQRKKRKSTDLNTSKKKSKSKKKKESESSQVEAEDDGTNKRKSVSEDETNSKKQKKSKKKRSDRSVSADSFEFTEKNDDKNIDNEVSLSETNINCHEPPELENKRKSSNPSDDDSVKKKSKTNKKKKNETSTSVDEPQNTNSNNEMAIKQENFQKQDKSIDISTADTSFDINVKVEPEVLEPQTIQQLNVCAKTEKISEKSNSSNSVTQQIEPAVQAASVQVSVEQINSVKIEPNSNIDTKKGIIEKSQPENTQIDQKQTILEQTYSQNDNLFEGLKVIDETFCTPTENSDSDSNLSALHEGGQDIQLVNLSKTSVVNKEEASTSAEMLGIVPKKLSLSNSTVEEIQNLMSDDPNCWKISHMDSVIDIQTTRVKRCSRCKELGHLAVKCKTRLEIKCRLCGAQGHFEPRCPNKICTQCGQKSNYSTTYCNHCFKLRYYTCSICYMTGHKENQCPDLWRRYHLTVTDGPPTTYNESVKKSQEQLWCAGCAQSGHLEHNCPWFKGQFPRTDPDIKQYEDVLFQHVPKPPIQCRLGPPVHNPSTSIQMAPEPASNYVEQSNQLPSLLSLPIPEPLHFVNLNSNQFSNFDHHHHNQQQQQQYQHQQVRVVDNNFCLENNLPNFISFDSSAELQQQQQPPPVREIGQTAHNPHNNGGVIQPPRPSTRTDKLRNTFFTANARYIKNFLDNKIRKMYRLKKNVYIVLKQLRAEIKRLKGIKDSAYSVLNTIIFGIYLKHEGRMHLERLKRVHPDEELTLKYRQLLFDSYNYIFGFEKHKHVNYIDMLHRI